MKAKESYKFYKGCFRLVGPIIRLFRPFKAVNADVSVGGALICANHSAMIDPFLIALALGIGTQVHVIAKAELFKIPVINTLLRKLGTISVDRGALDVNSIKTTLAYLKKGEKVIIFPEGTRVRQEEVNAGVGGAAKNGAVKLAERAGVPILPVFMPRKKPFFKKTLIVFGEPYLIEKQSVKRTADEWARLSAELMSNIDDLEKKAQ
ncbi:MAG: 1-acyl-sn-glycerol-3-phosphate acyltransferase [Oscillospiraceae bacterium]|nr:1-acyl-sn-glycerol-3-phosphate acyltransferase [Oscillospiraceae bacterium]